MVQLYESFSKSNVAGLEFEKVYPTFFSSARSVQIHAARDVYELTPIETKIEEKDITYPTVRASTNINLLR